MTTLATRTLKKHLPGWLALVLLTMLGLPGFSEDSAPETPEESGAFSTENQLDPDVTDQLAETESAPPPQVELPAISGIFADLTDDQEALRQAVDARILAEAALLVDVTSGEILYAKNIHAQHEPASTTKLMTALLAVELRDMNGRLLITEVDTRVEPSHVPLIPGETVKARDLLASTLIGSDNDSAIALARYAAGDLESFMVLMNDYARKIGCRNTIFQNPNGLPAPNQYTTAADLMIIFEQVLQKPILVEILKTKEFTLTTRAKSQQVRNHNRLLGTYDGMGPAKTGWTRASKHTYAAQATRGDRTLRLTLLKSVNKWNDARALFDYGFKVHPPTPAKVFLAAEDLEEQLLSGNREIPTNLELLDRLADIHESLEKPATPEEIQVAELVMSGPEAVSDLGSGLVREYLLAAAGEKITGTNTVKVQRGDTLQQIALRYNTTVDKLMEINNISNPNRIYPGDTLEVPAD